MKVVLVCPCCAEKSGRTRIRLNDMPEWDCCALCFSVCLLPVVFGEGVFNFRAALNPELKVKSNP